MNNAVNSLDLHSKTFNNTVTGLCSANKSKLVHYRGTFGFVQSAFVSCQTKEFLMRKKLQPGFCPRLPPSQKKKSDRKGNQV